MTQSKSCRTLCHESYRTIMLRENGDIISEERFAELLGEAEKKAREMNNLYKEAAMSRIEVLNEYFLKGYLLVDIGMKHGYCRERARQILNDGIEMIGCEKVYLK